MSEENKVDSSLIDTEVLADKTASLITAIMFYLVTAYGETSIITVLFLGSATTVFLLKSKGSVEIKIEPFFVFGILMICYSGLSSIWALEPYYSNKMTRNLFVTFICCVLIYLAYSKDDDTWDLMRSIKWGGYLMMIHQIRYYGIKQLLSMLVNMTRMTEIINANTLGMFISIGCVIEIMEIAKNKRLTFSSPLLIPSILVVAATQSRKAMLVLAIGILLSFCLYTIDRRHIFRSIIIIIIFICISYFLLKILNSSPLFAGISNRMTMLFNFIQEDEDIGHSLEARQEMIEIGWQQFLKTPILGVGIDNAQVVARNQTNGRIIAYLHNNYIELLCGGGCVGFMIYYSRYLYFVLCLGRSYRIQKGDYIPCVIFLAILLAIDYGFVSYFSRVTQLYLVLMFLQIRTFGRSTAGLNEIRTVNQFRYIKA